MINELSPEQWAKLPEFIDKWVKMASGETNTDAANKVATEMYKRMGLKKPLILHFTSPLLCHLALAFITNLRKDGEGKQLYSQLGSQLGSQLDSQLRSQLDSQLRSQLDSQLYSQLRSQLDSQLGSQLYSQLDSQLRSQLGSQFYSQLRSQLDSQLGSQLYSQLDSQLRSQLDSQLYSQFGSQLRSQLGSQLDSQLRSQLGSQLDSQLDSQLRSQLDSQLYSQLRSQLGSQLYSQLGSQLYSQLGSQFGSQLDSQLGSQFGSQLRSQLGSQLDSQLGSQYIVVWWLMWTGYYDFGKFINVKFDAELLRIFTEFTSNIHLCLPYENLFIYSQKPTDVHWLNHRLHSDSDMAVRYSDGWGWYCLNGIPMKPEYVLTPSVELTPETAFKEQNVDQRRELIRKIGVDKFRNAGKRIEQAGTYELLDMSSIFQGIKYAPHLLMLNPSVPDTWHLEGVHPDCHTVEQAINWRASRVTDTKWTPAQLS